MISTSTSSSACTEPVIQMRLQEAAGLNRNGTLSLLRNRHREAVKRFKEALEIVEEIAKEPLNDLFQQKQEASFPQIVEPSEDIEGLQDDRFFVFNHALIFNPSTHQDEQQVTEYDIFFYSAIIVYNIALAFHCAGMKKMDSTKSFTAAKAFYEKSLVICDSCASISPSCVFSATYDMVKLFAINNACHIHLEQGNTTDFQSCLEEVRMISYSLSGGKGFFHSFSTPPQEWEEEEDLFTNFILNAMVSWPAAAAPSA